MPIKALNSSLFVLFLTIGIFSCAKKVQPIPTSNEIQLDTLSKIESITLLDTLKKETDSLDLEEEIDNPDLNLRSEELKFNYLKAKSRVTWKTNNNQDNYTVDIRVKKDSLIWVNISVAMISGATGLFSQDRMQFYHKINHEYYNLTYDSLSVLMGFKINFNILQSLIVGNQPFNRRNSRVMRENDNFIFKQEEGQIKIENFVGPNRKLKKLLVKDEPSNNKLTMDYEDFATINQILFPFSSSVTLDVKNKDNQNKQTIISIKYSKVELLDTPLQFPFRVPEKLLKK
jgi:hypothetical protein